jgi:hypothetical protein
VEPPPEVELELEPELLLEELSLEEPPEFEDDEPFDVEVLVGGGTLTEPAACEPIDVAIPTIPLTLLTRVVAVAVFEVVAFWEPFPAHGLEPGGNCAFI